MLNAKMPINKLSKEIFVLDRDIRSKYKIYEVDVKKIVLPSIVFTSKNRQDERSHSIN